MLAGRIGSTERGSGKHTTTGNSRSLAKGTQSHAAIPAARSLTSSARIDTLTEGGHDIFWGCDFVSGEAGVNPVVDFLLYAAFYVKANTGMRRGEVLGLTWRNINFETARLSVAQTVVAPDYELTVSDVKTGHSLRTIDLDQRTIAVLRVWRARQLERHMLAGVRTDEFGFVFDRHDGSPLHPDFFS